MFTASARSRSLTFSSLAASFASVAPCLNRRRPFSVKVARHGSPSVAGGVDEYPEVQLDHRAVVLPDRLAGLSAHTGAFRRAARLPRSRGRPRPPAGGRLCYFCVDLGPRGRELRHGTSLSSCVLAGERAGNLVRTGLPR